MKQTAVEWLYENLILDGRKKSKKSKEGREGK